MIAQGIGAEWWENNIQERFCALEHSFSIRKICYRIWQ
jgi:hypothetical protein